MTGIEQLLAQYIELEYKKREQEAKKESDAALIDMYGKLERLQELSAKLSDAIAKRSLSFRLDEFTMKMKQDDLKEQIKDAWLDPSKKIYRSAQGITATLRTTRSLIVDSPKAVVEFLAKNDKIEEGVKAFNLTALRQYADAGLLNDGATHYDEKQSVSIKLPDPKPEEEQ